MEIRVDGTLIDAGPQHGDCSEAALDGGFVRDAVNTESKPANNRNIRSGKIANDFFSRLFPIRSWFSRSDDRKPNSAFESVSSSI